MNSSISNIDAVEKIQKKRGRKPKGGKLIDTPVSFHSNSNTTGVLANEIKKPNIILHLKCNLDDINEEEDNTQCFFNITNANKLTFDVLLYNNSMEKTDETINNNSVNINSSIANNNTNINTNNNFFYLKTEEDIQKSQEEDTNDDDLCSQQANYTEDLKEIWRKLKKLELNLHLNSCADKKSACFWCTYDFDNPAVYIPKHANTTGGYNVYGCFCSPECACAFLMNENIDNATKIERYQLLNHIYAKIYKYNKNIKPAPSPYYILNKFYGNMSIQNYRSMFNFDRLFLLVDKPLTKFMPELLIDNEDYILNKKTIPTIKLKRESKNNIISKNFGI